jgi:hypothetical protein
MKRLSYLSIYIAERLILLNGLFDNLSATHENAIFFSSSSALLVC